MAIKPMIIERTPHAIRNDLCRFSVEIPGPAVLTDTIVQAMPHPSHRLQDKIFPNSYVTGDDIGHVVGFNEYTRTWETTPIYRWMYSNVPVGFRGDMKHYLGFDCSDEAIVRVAFPVDILMHQEDIDGATIHELNDAETAWEFHRTRKGTHDDYELVVLPGIDSIFNPLFRQYEVDEIKATNDAGKERARRIRVMLSEIYGDMVTETQKIVRGHVRGHRHIIGEHPESGHISGDIQAALDIVKPKFLNDATAQEQTEIAASFTYIDRRLTFPSPEDPHTRRARLAAEAAAEEESPS